MFTATNRQTGETIRLSRDVATEHPAWVHARCGTRSEAELQANLDQCHQDEYRGMGPDVCGIAWVDEDEG